jgi:hypothetical protein
VAPWLQAVQKTPLQDGVIVSKETELPSLTWKPFPTCIVHLISRGNIVFNQDGNSM